MKVTFKNPLKNGIKQFDCGDPFIFRFNGVYYLFTTGVNPNVQGHVYKSLDLINYEYLGNFSDDELALGAFAPEVIYAYNKFYLAASPLGKGHYIFVSDKPEGPYKRITDNIHHLIDGSFTLDKNNNLYFLHAGQGGIEMCNMDEKGNVTNQRNIIADMDGWTEGPSIIQKNGKYYLFYCGNHYRAKGYRINCAISDNITGPYIEIPNNPILIDAEGKYTRLGHSSEVLSPDLLTYQMIYHSKTEVDANRNILMNKVHFDGDFVTVNNVCFAHSDYSTPTFESHNIESLSKVNGFYLSNIKAKLPFSLVANIKNDAEIIVSYKDEKNYIALKNEQNKLLVISYINKKENIIQTINHCFDFSSLHEIRLTSEGGLSIYIDNVYFEKLNLPKTSGYIGYRFTNECDVGYIALFNINEVNEIMSHQAYVPSIIGASSIIKNNQACLDSLSLMKNEEAVVPYLAERKNKYFLSLNANVREEASLLINEKEYALKNTDGYQFIPLGYIELAKKGNIVLKLLKGNINIKNIKVDKTNELKQINNFKIRNGYLIPSKNSDNYFFKGDKTSYKEIAMQFIPSKKIPYEGYGIVMNANNYSSELNQCRYTYNGILIEIVKDLLIVREVNYRLKTLTDCHINLKENELNTLKAKYENGSLVVTFNDKEMINYRINSRHTFGLSGYYASTNAPIKIKKEEA